jgi:hypothetical protein
MTLSHSIVWNLRRIPEDQWKDFLKRNLGDCLSLMGSDWDNALLSVYWYMLREILYWNKEPERSQEFFLKAKRIFD